MTPPIIHKDTCSCGAVTIRTYTTSMLTFNCHCSHCRASTGAPYCESSMFWKCAVGLVGPIEYHRTSAQGGLIGLDRGRCSDCHDPVIDVGRALLSMFRFPSAKVLRLEPDTNIFYNSGEQGGTLGLKTYKADFMSSVFVYPIILCKGVRSCFICFGPGPSEACFVEARRSIPKLLRMTRRLTRSYPTS
jgi:hypothetical protein